jgi:hypothetical protein
MRSKKKRSQRPPQDDRTPVFHPIEVLAGIAVLIDGQTRDAEELWQGLAPAREEPFLLDEECVARIDSLYSDSLDDAWVFEEQLERWQALDLNQEQRAEVERLQGRMSRFRQTAGQLVAMARELRGKKTIEALLQMDDLELGLATLTGQIPWPRPQRDTRPPAPSEPFRMPREVTTTKGQDAQGRHYYGFHHEKLGYLGRITLTDLAEGGVDVKAECPNDPAETREIRQTIFLPLAMELIEHLQRQTNSRAES